MFQSLDYLSYISVYREKLPFVRPAPIEEQESKKQKKQQSGKKDKSQKVTDGVDKMAIGDNWIWGELDIWTMLGENLFRPPDKSAYMKFIIIQNMCFGYSKEPS